jgi:hypothetical protein
VAESPAVDDFPLVSDQDDGPWDSTSVNFSLGKRSDRLKVSLAQPL